jgi:H+/Cl- antiporter ClcA
MNKTFLIFGIVLAVVGAVVYYLASFTDLIGNRTHHTIPLGGLGLVVLGALILIGGVMMGRPAGGTTANQFKCDKCGAVFGSQTALAQHSEDKHGLQAS